MFNLEAFNRAIIKAKDRQSKQQSTAYKHSTASNERAAITADEQYRTTRLSKMLAHITKLKEVNYK
ncbi:hypothetical protein [Pseudomonas lactucae]|uniref:hypothetical protein n=1 Tax=Pseudomonas lactucae TaxID=2813360 RepID=UPI002FCD1E60